MNQLDPKYEHKVLGWTWDQWAIVFGRFEIDTVKTHGDALHIRKLWRQGNPADPGEIVLEGIELPRNHEAVCDLFSLPMRLQHATPGAL